jgi:hypothetical protein
MLQSYAAYLPQWPRQPRRDDLPWNVARAHMVGMRATQFPSVDALKGFLAQEHLYTLTAKLC